MGNASSLGHFEKVNKELFATWLKNTRQHHIEQLKSDKVEKLSILAL